MKPQSFRGLVYLCALIFPILFCAQCSSLAYRGPITVVLNEKKDQGKFKRIAVIPFDTKEYKGHDGETGVTVADWYGAELLKIGYDVIERARVTKILDEQAFQMTGAVEYNTAIKAGKLLGAQAIVYGSAAGKPGQFTSIVKLIDLETSETIWSLVVETNVPRNAIAELKEALDKYYKNKK